MNQKDYLQTSIFEEDYLLRSLGGVVNDSHIALTELVANAWDAGAFNVRITIPKNLDETIVIDDDGCGLTPEEFSQRWMRLGYNRIKHQGNSVVFPDQIEANRLAYGKNGIGRHGLLCFNNEYVVKTKAGGFSSCYTISTASQDQPLVVTKRDIIEGAGHGTTLSVVVKKNLPDANRLLDVLSARFLHDPSFNVFINGQCVPLEEHSGLLDTSTITLPDGKNLVCMFIDTTQASKKTIYQGIAFWIRNRLVGEPSWELGNKPIMDGRTKIAKRYTCIVKTNDLADYILDDWTGFKKHPVMDIVYQKVEEYVESMVKTIVSENIEETKGQIKSEFKDDIKNLSPLGKWEVDEAIEKISQDYPLAKFETYSIAVDTVIKLESSRNGKELLTKIGQLTDDDVEGLNKLLSTWNIKDALCVLDEIDRRISVIEAISKLSSDSAVDELHTLHPLITEARWLFGPEFDSPEYVSNRQLQTAAKQIFKTSVSNDSFLNHKKRPDLVILEDSTLSITGTSSFDPAQSLLRLQRVLIIELKRGGFCITRDERNQAQNYVEDFTTCPDLVDMSFIYAFVVGESIGQGVESPIIIPNKGSIAVTTFSQLIDTANRRLFNLRDRISERYNDIPGIDLTPKSEQLQIELSQSTEQKKQLTVSK